MRRIFLVWACSALPVTLFGSLDVLSSCFLKRSYRDPGATHILLQNNGIEDLSVEKTFYNGKKLSLGNPQWSQTVDNGGPLTANFSIPHNLNKHPEVLWHYYTEENVPAFGGITELIIKYIKLPTKETAFIKIADTTGFDTKVKVPLQKTPLMMRFVGFEKNFRVAYFYPENFSENPVTLKTFMINGIAHKTSPSMKDYLLGSGKISMFKVVFSSPLKKAERIYYSLKTKTGSSIDGSTRAFSHFPIIGDEAHGIPSDRDGLDWEMITGSFYDLQADPWTVSARIIHQLKKRRSSGKFQYMLVNQASYPEHVVLFGALCDAYLLHPQPTDMPYVGKFTDRNPHYVQEKCDYISQHITPNPLIPITSITHSYGKFYGTMSDETQLLRIFYSLSRNAKGIHYRSWHQDKYTPVAWGERKKLLKNIHLFVNKMKSWLRIGCHVPHLANTDNELIEASSLLCGDKGILLFLFNHNRNIFYPKGELEGSGPSVQHTSAPSTFRVRLHPEKWMNLRNVFEWVSDGSYRKHVMQEENTISLPSIKNLRVFILPFDEASFSDTEVQGSSPIKVEQKPFSVMQKLIELYEDATAHVLQKKYPQWLSQRIAKQLGIDPEIQNLSTSITITNHTGENLSVKMRATPPLQVEVENMVLPPYASTQLVVNVQPYKAGKFLLPISVKSDSYKETIHIAAHFSPSIKLQGQLSNPFRYIGYRGGACTPDKIMQGTHALPFSHATQSIRGEHAYYDIYGQNNAVLHNVELNETPGHNIPLEITMRNGINIKSTPHHDPSKEEERIIFKPPRCFIKTSKPHPQALTLSSPNPVAIKNIVYDAALFKLEWDQNTKATRHTIRITYIGQNLQGFHRKFILLHLNEKKEKILVFLVD